MSDGFFTSLAKKRVANKRKYASQAVEAVPLEEPKALPLRSISPVSRIERSSSVVSSDSEVVKLIADYGISGAELIKTISGMVVDKEIIKLPRGSRLTKLSNRLSDMRRDFGKPFTIDPFLPEYLSCISIDVPAKKREIVYFEDILKSKEWKDAKERMHLPAMLGVDTIGRPIIKDFAVFLHMILAGKSGAGKTSGAHSILFGLMDALSPDQVRFQLNDPKMMDLSLYKGSPYLWGEVCTSFEDIYSAIESLLAEINRRKIIIEASGSVNIWEHNEKVNNPLCAIISDIDEIASVHINQKVEIDDVSKSKRAWMLEVLPTAIQQARAVGVHFMMGSQKPSATAIPDDIQANIDLVVALTTVSEDQSNFLIDSPNCAYLLEKGDALIFDREKSSYTRLHMPYVGEGREIAEKLYSLTNKPTQTCSLA